MLFIKRLLGTERYARRSGTSFGRCAVLRLVGSLAIVSAAAQAAGIARAPALAAMPAAAAPAPVSVASPAATAPASTEAFAGAKPEALLESYDVVVAGAGTGGFGTAIQAARMGASVLLLEETEWIGGQALAAAVTAMDEGGAGNLVRGRGLYQELVQRSIAHYEPLGLNPLLVGRSTNTRIEPRVGRAIMHRMLEEAGKSARLDLSLRSRVVQVRREGGAVRGVEIEIATPQGAVRRSIASRILVDATEWGDVLPLAGVRYRSGNRISGALDPARRIQDNTWTAVVRRYPAGVPESLRLKQPPPGYASRRAAFAKSLVPGTAPRRTGEPMSLGAFIEYRGMPDSAFLEPAAAITRTHLNYNNDYPCTVAYLEDPANRRDTDRAMRLRTLQLLYFVQNEMGLADWSVADDEGFDTPYNRAAIDAWLRDEPALEPYRQILYHFSVIPYVRESRRLVGLHTLRAAEIARGPGKAPTPFPTVVALGDYRLDLHGGRRAEDLELELDRVTDLEDAQPGRAGPFAIPMEVLIPETIEGFLAAEKNFSQTRLVNGATRMQPHTLNLGQAVGALAALSVRHGVPPRRIDPVLVQRAILAGCSTLQLAPLVDVEQRAPDWAAIQLVSARGLLSFEKGLFAPHRPLARADFETLWQRLAGRAELVRSSGPAAPDKAVVSEKSGKRGDADRAKSADKGASEAVASDKPSTAKTLRTEAVVETVTRAEFAKALESAAGRREPAESAGGPNGAAGKAQHSGATVRVLFDGASSAAARAITRSEAAQVLAEFLELRALASLLGKPQALDWRTPRAASSGVVAAGKSPLEAQLRRLAAAKIIDETDYWLTHAVEGQECDGGKVALLLERGAKLLDPKAGPKDTLDVLVRTGVLSSRPYWEKNAAPGGKCLGRNVGIVVQRLSERIVASGRPAAR